MDASALNQRQALARFSSQNLKPSNSKTEQERYLANLHRRIGYSQPAMARPGLRHQELLAASTQGEKILIVDDLRDMRRFVGRALSDRGYRVFQAGNGEQGIEVARKISRT